jgi:hypothetical protein
MPMTRQYILIPITAANVTARLPQQLQRNLDAAIRVRRFEKHTLVSLGLLNEARMWSSVSVCTMQNDWMPSEAKGAA